MNRSHGCIVCGIIRNGNDRKVYKLIILYNIMQRRKKIIMKVWENKALHQKLITIPKDCDIKPGEYVEVKRVD